MVIDKFSFISAIFALKNNNMEETIGNDHNLMLISIFSLCSRLSLSVQFIPVYMMCWMLCLTLTLDLDWKHFVQ